MTHRLAALKDRLCIIMPPPYAGLQSDVACIAPQGVASLVKRRTQAAAGGELQHVRPMLLFPEVRDAKNKHHGVSFAESFL